MKPNVVVAATVAGLLQSHRGIRSCCRCRSCNVPLPVSTLSSSSSADILLDFDCASSFVGWYSTVQYSIIVHEHGCLDVSHTQSLASNHLLHCPHTKNDLPSSARSLASSAQSHDTLISHVCDDSQPIKSNSDTHQRWRRVAPQHGSKLVLPPFGHSHRARSRRLVLAAGEIGRAHV